MLVVSQYLRFEQSYSVFVARRARVANHTYFCPWLTTQDEYFLDKWTKYITIVRRIFSNDSNVETHATLSIQPSEKSSATSAFSRIAS